jgi:hypothetical protein
MPYYACKSAKFLFICFGFSLCFAQINPMGYFYRYLDEENIPDFAALAVLERQNCPLGIMDEEQICTSRYKIVRILDAKSDTMKKEYVEAKEKPVFPYFRHRPVLIFGKYKDGYLQIEGYEDMREYFGDFTCYFRNCIESRDLDFYPFVGLFGDIYAFHSIGTPYYDTKNLDSVDMLYYNEYLVPYIRHGVEVAGKNFDELLLRLTKNRTPIKAAKIKNDFVALGAIKKMRPFNDSIYELSVKIETVFKNDAKIDSSIPIFLDINRLKLGWGCQPFDYYLKWDKAFYFFGNSIDGSLVIDSLVSPQDIFVFADTVYDISMGFPFEELISYFFPSNISIEEFRFGKRWRYLDFTKIRKGKIPESMASMPECLKNDIIKIAIKWEDYWDNYKKRPREKPKFDWSLYKLPMLGYDDMFRCRKHFKRHICRFNSNFSELIGIGAPTNIWNKWYKEFE